MAEYEEFRSPAEIRHRIGPTGLLSLSSVSGDIRLRATDGDEAIVSARWDGGGGDQPLPLLVRRSEDALHVETDEQSTGWFPFRNRGAIEFDVSIPKGARVEVTAVSADVEAHGLVGDQAYRTVSGDLVVDGGGGRVSATTVSGDVQVTGVQPLELNATTTSGDIEAYGQSFDPVRLRTVSGDLELRGKFADGPQHTVESVSGDLSIDALSGLTVDTKRGLDFSKSGKQPIVVGDGSAKLRFRSLSGDVDVNGPRVKHQTVRPEPREQEGELEDANEESSQDSMAILRALERGEIDVEEASRRLEGAGSRG